MAQIVNVPIVPQHSCSVPDISLSMVKAFVFFLPYVTFL